MKIRAILCVPLGHHWHKVPTPDPLTVLQCSRCGRRREVVEGTGFDKRIDLMRKTGL
jgi:hypothetical protein